MISGIVKVNDNIKNRLILTSPARGLILDVRIWRL